MSGPAASRRDLEALWKERTRDARRLYRIAQAECERVRQEQHGGSAPSQDAHRAISIALQIENAALAEYSRVLKIFTDLTVSGKMPPAE
jgi:hypothetical protein